MNKGYCLISPANRVDYLTVLYDEACPLCTNSVEWLRKRMRPGRLVFIELGSDEGMALRSNLPATIRDLDTMFLIRSRDGRSWVRSTAALLSTRGLRHPWRWLVAGLIVPRPIRDWCYRQVARRRQRITCTKAECIHESQSDSSSNE